MKYIQTNTKPSYTPRKLIGGLTQQSAQPEPQNSAGTRHGELNLGSEKPQQVGNRFWGRREDGDWGGGQNTVKAPLPKSSWRESGKLETAAGTKLKREKLQLHSSIPGSALVGRVNPQEDSGVWEVLRPHGKKWFHCWKDIW